MCIYHKFIVQIVILNQFRKMVWLEIFKFEIKYRLKRIDTYIFFTILLLFSMIATDFIFQGENIGAIKLNAPLMVAKTMGAITGTFMILASMIMGVSILRDFEYQIESLMFINPIKKRDYLMGRFLGAFIVLLFIFSSIAFGMILGDQIPWPWRDASDLLPFRFITYIQSFVTIVLPILFFGASLFFVTGALSRNLVVVYTQGIVFFVIFILTKSIPNKFLQALIDPFSFTTIARHVESWTVAERNAQNIPFTDVLLYNKLFWLILAVLILIFGYKKFTFNVIKSKKNTTKRIPVLDIKRKQKSINKSPKFQLSYNLKSKWIQLMHTSWFHVISICKQSSFWGIVISGIVIILINSVSLGTVYGVDSYPTTYFILEELQEMSIFFFLIILVFYSGELVWMERQAKLDMIYDASSMSNFVNLIGKYLGLMLVNIVILTSLIISGIIFQTIKGYYNYELHVYFYGFFLEILPLIALYTCMVFFIHTITNQKFIGHMIFLVLFIFMNALKFLGFDHDLYLFGGSSLGTYSDMNGYGHFLKPYLFFKTYWLLFGTLLLIIGAVLSVRGNETSLVKRFKTVKYRLSKSLVIFGFSVIVGFILLGGYIYYNTNVLNTYWTNSEQTTFRVNYERTLKKFEYTPQPKIVAVRLKLELYPKTRDYSVEGDYVLKNTNNTAINEIHIQKLIDSQVALEYVTFNEETAVNNQYKAFHYSIYKLSKALEPGDSIQMNFKQTYTTKGFRVNRANTNIVNNGTFFKNSDFPTLGYDQKYELRDEGDRADYNLVPRASMAKIDDAIEQLNARNGSDSNGINLDIIIGTDEDQIAIAPGNLLKTWKESNRSYFHYKTDQPIINFYGLVSADYTIKKDVWLPKEDKLSRPVDLEIYYHKDHSYNLDRMMASMKASFDYYSKNFSPYQYQHMRIMEFPRYSEFAQSFAGTVPFSEAIGFVLDINDEKDVDMAFYITAHEVAHQWWGMQLEAANVQGRYFILETLSQYSALMVLKQKYSEEKVRQFLQMENYNYSNEKLKEVGPEPPLALVENQNYIYYSKGVINMCAFQKQIGEDNINLALRRFLKDWNSITGKLKRKTKRYATANDLLEYFKAVTPSSSQHVIHDLFESVTPLAIHDK